MNEINEILLRRKHLVMLEKNPNKCETTKTEKALVISIAKNVEAYGFTFSKELMETLLTYPKSEIESFYKDFMPKLKRLVGADKVYRPMYPNFPQQVMDASDAELFLNAILHYFTFGQWMPEYEKEERLPLFDTTKMTLLSVGTKSDLMDVFKNLVGSKTSLSAQDKADVESIIMNNVDYANYLPDEIPLKENVAFLGRLIIEKAPIKNSVAIQKYFKTATDVLRLITAMSDGDISLAAKTKYRKLRRVERRMIMDLLSGCVNLVEDMFRYQYEWIRIGEIVHPGEYSASKYDSVNAAFVLLRTNKKPLMFAGKVHKAITSGNMKEAATLLKARPGDFARQLDKVLRDAKDKNYIVNCFNAVANDVSTPVLLQVRQHFIGRLNNNEKVRVFFPKGNLAKAISIPNELPVIEDVYCKAIVKICENALIENYKSKEFMGSVYVDEELKGYIVPFSQRSASSAAKIVVRGSKLPIRDEATIIRGFIWWTNSDKGNTWYGNRVDIDLSVGFYDENWRLLERVAYTNLRNAKFKAYHSGDITDGGNVNGKGVAEFIDFDISAVSKNARYAAFQIYSYTGQKYSDLPNVRFGWMEREDYGSGEIFEPSTVEMSIDVNAKSTVAIPAIIDCKERKVIWCDMNLGIDSIKGYCGGNNLESNITGVTATCHAIVNMNKANIYDLITLNAKARGILTTDRNEADIIFSNNLTVPVEMVEVEDEKTKEKKLVQREKTNVPIITAFDTDYFMGQLL